MVARSYLSLAGAARQPENRCPKRKLSIRHAQDKKHSSLHSLRASEYLHITRHTDTVLQLTSKHRDELLESAALETGMSAVILEKDFWVCWTLKELSRLTTMGAYLIFKGGTLLSKAFKIFERFCQSEWCSHFMPLCKRG
jgi:hypothetical protein